MSGLSNACFKVTLRDGLTAEPSVILYRRFEQTLTDMRIEEAIFKVNSDDGTGPKLHYQNAEFRIESFYEGRVISIWELRNPAILKSLVKMICRYQFHPVTNQKV